jgi:hypothetical protein
LNPSLHYPSSNEEHTFRQSSEQSASAYESFSAAASWCSAAQHRIRGKIISSSKILMHAAIGIANSNPNIPPNEPPMMTTTRTVAAFKLVWPL